MVSPMSRVHWTIWGWMLLCLTNWTSAGPVELPEDPAVPVAELWYVQGGQLSEPEVAVFANGRVRVSVGDGSLWGELPPQLVQTLVSSLLDQDGLRSLTTTQMQAEIHAASQKMGLSCQIEHAGDTIIRVQTRDGSYRVDGHAVGLLSTRFPDVVCLQHYYAAQNRLENIRAIVMVGGPEAAENIAKLARSQIQRVQGEQIEIHVGHLAIVRAMADGSRYCQFQIPASGPVPRPHSPRIISIIEAPGEVPQVSVLPEGPAFR